MWMKKRENKFWLKLCHFCCTDIESFYGFTSIYLLWLHFLLFLDGLSPCVEKENLCSTWKALYVWETETREREKMYYKPQYGRNKDNHWDQSLLRKNPAAFSWEECICHLPLRTFLRSKKTVELWTWITHFPSAETLECSREKRWLRDAGDGASHAQTSLFVGHSKSTGLFLQMLPNDPCQVLLKTGGSLSRGHFRVG